MKHGQKSGILQLVPKSYGQAVRMSSPGRKTSLIVRYDELLPVARSDSELSLDSDSKLRQYANCGLNAEESVLI